MRKLCRLLPVLGLSVLGAASLGASTAHAAEVTRVASSFDGDNKFDLHFGVGYDFNFKQAAILREWSDPNNPKSTMVRDLIYRQMRHVVTPSLEIGLYKDIAIYANLPIVVSDKRTYAFDQDAEPCVFADQASGTNPATCVRHDNSTSIRDGIIPRDGFDATNTSTPFGQFGGMDTQTIFKGANRFGLDQIVTGLKIGILNQDRLSHMPKWVIGLEGRFAIGKPMTFSRDIVNEDPAGNHRVGRGTHELGVWTALSRRYRFLDPFFTAWWYQAVRANNTEFRNFGGNQDRVNPQSNTGVSFGAEIVPFERKAKGQKVALNLRGLAMLKYGGRGYSEAWELLSDSPALVGTYQPGQAGLGCSRTDVDRVIQYAKDNPTDPDPLANSGSPQGCQRFNGITNIQDFATFGLNVALHAQLNKYAVLMIGANLSTDTRHFITAANRGKANGDPSSDPKLVDSDKEINPVRRDVVDQVGRRYAVGDVLSAMGYFRFLLTF